MTEVKGKGTAKAPWKLTTPPGTSEFEAWKDEEADPPALVVQVGEALGLAEVERNPKNNRMRAT